MSYTFLLESGEESTVESLRDIPVSALSKFPPIVGLSCFNDREIESFHASQSGTTFVPLTVSYGADQLILFAEDFPAQTSVPQGQTAAPMAELLELMEQARDFGSRCSESLAKFGLSLSVLKTPRICELRDSAEFSRGLPAWGIMQNGVCLAVATSVQITKEIASGYPPLLPTPTAHNAKEGAYPAEFTRNTPTLSAQIGGKVNPDWNEQRMGLPIKASDLRPSEMHNHLSWLQLHGEF